MISEDKVEKVRDLWIKGSNQLGFKIISPFEVEINGKKIILFALVPQYGKRNGTIIYLIDNLLESVDKEILEWIRENNYHMSIMPVTGTLSYNEDFIRDCLEDWSKVTD